VLGETRTHGLVIPSKKAVRKAFAPYSAWVEIDSPSGNLYNIHDTISDELDDDRKYSKATQKIQVL
jgi:hypothetical protein